MEYVSDLYITGNHISFFGLDGCVHWNFLQNLIQCVHHSVVLCLPTYSFVLLRFSDSPKSQNIYKYLLLFDVVSCCCFCFCLVMWSDSIYEQHNHSFTFLIWWSNVTVTLLKGLLSLCMGYIFVCALNVFVQKKQLTKIYG